MGLLSGASRACALSALPGSASRGAVDNARRRQPTHGRVWAMTLHRYEFRSVEKLVGDVADQVSFVAGNVYVALVARPSTEQRLVKVRCLRTPALIDDWDDASVEL